MLHKLEMPAYRSQLEAILDFQYQLLSFACTPPALPLSPTILKTEFGEQSGGWLSNRCWTGGRSSLFHIELEKLITYVTERPLEGTEIVDAFINDRDFYKHLDDPDFEFHYTNLAQSTKDVVAPLMISFYKKLLETGFPDYIHLCKAEKFTRKILLKGFYAANPYLMVCPGCDGPRPMLGNKTRNIKMEKGEEGDSKRDYAEIDHFFPKSFYPYFSVHFMNLVPLCPTCNIKAKQDKDPLNKCIGKGALQYTFMPFIKPAVSCIEVTMSKNGNLRRVIIKDTQQVSSQRMKNLDTTFELGANWEHHLEGWIDSMTFQIRGLQSRGRGNRKKIEREIKKRLAPLAKAQEESVGQITHLLVQRGYANYALRDQQELELLINQAMDDNAPKRR